MLHTQKILVPVDFSEESALALDWAIRLAFTEPGASIVLCHVLKPIYAPVGPETMLYDVGAATKEEAKRELPKWLAKIPWTISSSSVITEGRVSEQVAKIVEKERVDLVVMTTHGRKGLAHWVMGSAAEETVRLAPCPVLVLHMNEKARESMVKTA
jgi:nucleotide-binding universal stress UspA family protein